MYVKDIYATAATTTHASAVMKNSPRGLSRNWNAGGSGIEKPKISIISI
jgi:hypothetical protein